MGGPFFAANSDRMGETFTAGIETRMPRRHKWWRDIFSLRRRVEKPLYIKIRDWCLFVIGTFLFALALAKIIIGR